jgi:O-methyltransferase involved in polyketide biosynthesis
LLTSQAVFDFDTYQIKDSKYGIFGLDLVKVEQLRATLEDFKVDFKVPTLIFAECVLTYINTESTTQLLHGIASWFPTLTFINYEMFNGSDLFGKMMVRNFEVNSIY